MEFCTVSLIERQDEGPIHAGWAIEAGAPGRWAKTKLLSIYIHESPARILDEQSRGEVLGVESE